MISEIKNKIKNTFKKEELSEEDRIKLEERKVRARMERKRNAKKAGLVLAGAAVGAGGMYLYQKYAPTDTEDFESIEDGLAELERLEQQELGF